MSATDDLFEGQIEHIKNGRRATAQALDDMILNDPTVSLKQRKVLIELQDTFVRQNRLLFILADEIKNLRKDVIYLKAKTSD